MLVISLRDSQRASNIVSMGQQFGVCSSTSQGKTAYLHQCVFRKHQVIHRPVSLVWMLLTHLTFDQRQTEDFCEMSMMLIVFRRTMKTENTINANKHAEQQKRCLENADRAVTMKMEQKESRGLHPTLHYRLQHSLTTIAPFVHSYNQTLSSSKIHRSTFSPHQHHSSPSLATAQK